MLWLEKKKKSFSSNAKHFVPAAAQAHKYVSNPVVFEIKRLFDFRHMSKFIAGWIRESFYRFKAHGSVLFIDVVLILHHCISQGKEAPGSQGNMKGRRLFLWVLANLQITLCLCAEDIAILHRLSQTQLLCLSVGIHNWALQVHWTPQKARKKVALSFPPVPTHIFPTQRVIRAYTEQCTHIHSRLPLWVGDMGD